MDAERQHLSADHNCTNANGAPAFETPQSYVLAADQARVWVLSNLEGDSRPFCTLRAIRIRGRLDTALLERCINRLIERYDILRTRFPLRSGTPVAEVIGARHMTVPLVPIVAGSGASEEARHITTFIDSINFDLTTECANCFRLFQCGDEEFILAALTHLLVADAASVDLLLQELMCNYHAFILTGGFPQQASAVQFGAFAVTQQAWLQSTEGSEQVRYWRDRFADEIPALQLPTDRKHGSAQTYQGQVIARSVGSELRVSLESLASENLASLESVLFLIYYIVLGRYAGQNDFVVGVHRSGQRHCGFPELIGLCQTYLPIRMRLSFSLRFVELLRQVNEEISNAERHGNVPVSRLIDEIDLKRDPSRPPLFQTIFAMGCAEKAFSDAAEPLAEPLDVFGGYVRYELSLRAMLTSNGIKLEFEYNSGLFDASTIEQFANSFVGTLSAVVANPNAGLLDYPLVPSEHLALQILQSHGTELRSAPTACIHSLIEVQVEKCPTATAVTDGRRLLTYKEMNAQANRIAKQLIGLGVGAEVLVGVSVERSVEMVVALLGVLKAGGAYVPLDPSYPSERLNVMLTDSGASILITTERLLQSNGFADGLQRVIIDLDGEDALQSDRVNPRQSLLPTNLAYVMYTSGSTGRPKGVMIEHRNVVNLLTWGQQLFDPEELNVVLASTSMCFDLSVFEMFLPLTLGKEVRVVENLLSLRDQATGVGVTYINTVPSAMNSLLSVAKLPETVRTVGFCGEPLSIGLVNDVYARSSVTRVIDYYGPTETTVYSSSAEREPRGRMTVGRPLANTQIYFLDPSGNVVPPKVMGELHIGGEGVARGYHGRADLTAERFVPDALGRTPGARLYRTGDLGRYVADATIELSGRADYQVKIRGFRIELGEVEKAILQFPGVPEAVVVVQTLGSGDKQLVAYVGAPQGNFQTESLRRFLASKLPNHMVPSLLVSMDALPRTPNGKIDRRGLPDPDSKTQDTRASSAPVSELEQRLLGFWREILQRQAIGVEDNFFQVGGHSLLAVRFIARVKDELGVDVPLAMVFQAPTVAQFAKAMQLSGWSSPWYSLVPIQPSGHRPILFGIHTLSLKELPRHLGNDQPLYFIRYGMAAELHGRSLDLPTVEELARHYVDEMRRFQPHGPYYMMGASFGGLVAYEMACQLADAGCETGLIVMFDSYLRTDRERLPWWQIVKNLCTSTRADLWARVQRKLEKKRGLELYGTKYWPHVYTPTPDLAIWAQYKPRPYAGPVTLFKAADGWGSILYRHFPPEVAWREIGAQINICEVPGGHISMLEEPFVQLVSERLRECIDSAISPAKPVVVREPA